MHKKKGSGVSVCVCVCPSSLPKVQEVDDLNLLGSECDPYPRGTKTLQGSWGSHRVSSSSERSRETFHADVLNSSLTR